MDYSKEIIQFDKKLNLVIRNGNHEQLSQMLNDDIFKKEYKLGWSFKSYHHLKTPLVLAVDSKSKKIVKLLLKSGVDVFEGKIW